ncbi:hypothetical protein DSM112329_04723 [Paraconexibacter sp. AEG42_29]|uniref:2'-5' RNA ligase n=1 Tax=Paraconexibacter sp. AEG42_29 TaxID=2997339 RepID=A0AAU7B2D0_9ACTN
MPDRPQNGQSLIFPVTLDLPKHLELGGTTWHCRREHHVTTFTPDLAVAVGRPLADLIALGQRHEPALTEPRGVHFDGRAATAERDDGRRSLVAFCDVDGLAEVYAQLSADLGTPVPLPPNHVTLYSSDARDKGIGLATADAVAAYTTPLTPEQAAVLTKTLPR